MSKTLDEILDDYGIFDGATTKWDATDANGLRQAILQWVADKVVGEDEPTKNLLDPLRDHKVLRNSVRVEQRQILKQHGWKGGE